MGLVISEDDFVGRWELTLPAFQDKRQALIDTINSYEKQELTRLFGTDMLADFIANPTTYSALGDPIMEQLGHRKSFYSESLKNTLLSFVYLRIAKQGYVVPQENGRIQVDMQNGKLVNPYVRDTDMYNMAVDGWRAIQIYCRKHYDLFKGVDKPYKFY